MTRAPRSPRNRPRWRAVAATLGTAIAAMVPVGVAVVATSGAAAASVPAAPSGWSTVWSDDFNGPAGSAPSSANWLYDTGTGYPGGAANWGTGEVETMTNSTANVYLDGNGDLAIKPIRDANGNWTSGRIETQRTDFGAPAGGVEEIEARIQQPNVTTANGAGYWPAFWALGAAARPAAASNWPSIGELDMMEDVNGMSSEFATLHCGTDPGGPCNETTGIGSGQQACSGCQTGFHTYAVQIDRSTSPEQLRYYLDGNNFFTINSNQVDATTWANAVDHGFFIILNVAMGGGFPDAFGGGPNAATISGQPMLVDYVAVYQKGGSGSGSGSGGGSGSASAGASGAVKSGITGKCMDVDGANSADGTPVQLYDCNNTTAQNWTAYSDGTLRALGKCLDATGQGTTNGTKLQLWDCNGQPNQVWQPYHGGYQNPASGRCVDDPNSTTTNFTQLQLWDCNGTNAQKWSTPGAQPDPDLGATITGPGGKCVDVAGDDTGTNNAAVQLWDCQPWAADQHWTYTSGTLQTLGRCLDITGGATTDGTKVQLYDCNNTGAQQWTPGPNGSLINPQSGKCLDDPSGSTTNGTRLQIWDCNNSTAQDWTSTQITSSGSSGGGTSGGSTVSATSTIQAEAYTNQSGTITENCTDTGCGEDIGAIGNGDWLQYNNVDFGTSGLHTFTARVASGAGSGVSGLVEVHLDSLSNPAIGSFSVGNTGGWQSWESIPANISTTTGTHTVYLEFSTGSGQDFVNVNWFTFS